MEGLIAVLDNLRELTRRAGALEDWSELVHTAFDEGVGGILLLSLRRTGVEMPRDVTLRAEEILARDRLWHRKLLADFHRVQEAFNRGGVRAVALKGPILAERLYPEPALRPSGDLDLLVEPREFECAATILRALGCRPVRGASLAHHVAFELPEGTKIDLHKKASSNFATTLAGETLVERCFRHRTGSGLEVRILEPADEVLFLAIHAARHRFTRLGWLWELREAIRRLDSRELTALFDRARGEGVERALSATLVVLEQRLEWSVPSAAASSIRRDARLSVAVRLSHLATDPRLNRAGFLLKSYRFVCHQTYRALLAESPRAGLRHIARAAGQTLRRRLRS